MKKLPSSAPTSLRRDLVKAYMMALAAEGHFAGLRSPIAIAYKAGKILARDVQESAEELAIPVLHSAGQRLKDSILRKMEKTVNEISTHGIGHVLNKFNTLYQEGLDSLASQRSCKK